MLKVGDAPACSRAALILTGYRPELTAADAVRSVVRWHNETVNIWSHLVAAGTFAALAARAALAEDPRRLLAAYCATVAAGLAASAGFHVFSCNNQLYDAALRIDVCGIHAIIAACVGTTIYVVTSGRATVMVTHLSLFAVCLAATLVGFMRAGAGAHNGRSENLFRGPAQLVGLAVSVCYWLVAVAHVAVVEQSAAAMRHAVRFAPEYAMWFATFAVWKARLPERACPALFDYAGNSHNLFHIIGFGTALYHYTNLRDALG